MWDTRCQQSIQGRCSGHRQCVCGLQLGGVCMGGLRADVSRHVCPCCRWQRLPNTDPSASRLKLFRRPADMKLLPVLCGLLALATLQRADAQLVAGRPLPKKPPFSFEGSAMLIFYYSGRSIAAARRRAACRGTGASGGPFAPPFLPLPHTNAECTPLGQHP